MRNRALLLERAPAGLAFRGVKKIDIDSESMIMEFLTDTSFVSHYDDTGAAVQKHIILVLQAHILFEDCLYMGKYQDGQKGKAWAAIQKAVGLSPGFQGPLKGVPPLLRACGRARRD